MDFKTTCTVAVLCLIHFIHYSPYSGQIVLFCFFFSITSCIASYLYHVLRCSFNSKGHFLSYLVTSHSLPSFHLSNMNALLCAAFFLNTDQNQAPTLHTYLLPLFLFNPFDLEFLNFPRNNWHSSSCYTLMGKKINSLGWSLKWLMDF